MRHRTPNQLHASMYMFEPKEKIIEKNKQKYRKKLYIEGILKILNKKNNKELEEIYYNLKQEYK